MKTEAKTKAPTPRLTCIITGRTRLTNEDYLNDKASGPSQSIKAFTNNYVCKDALKMLRANPTVEGVEEIRKALGTTNNLPTEGWTPSEISKNAISRILSFNGKQKAASVAPATPAEVKTEAKPAKKAPAKPRAKKTTTLVETPESEETSEEKTEGVES